MRQKWNHIISVLIIIVLLPYIITVFFQGPAVLTGAEPGKDYLIVEKDGKTRQMSMEDYGILLLAKEIPVEYEPEALKAQAVLVRTRIYKQLTEQGKESVFKEDFPERETLRRQWGQAHYQIYYETLKKAWQQTEGQVLTYENQLIQTPFHQLSNGSTRSGNEVFGSEGYPYLMPKECPADVAAKNELQNVMLEQADYEILKTDSAGYVLQLREGDVTFTGEEFREEKGLASACFTLQEFEGKIRVTTRGQGHGLGLSQYTANVMAEEGSSHEDILLYFYTNVKVKEVAEIL